MRIAILLFLLSVTTAQAQVPHYAVKLTPDLDHHLLRGEETIDFHHAAGTVVWQKQAGLQISSISSTDGETALRDRAVSIRLRTSGKHLLHLQYTAAPARGITWFKDQAGFDTEFYCQAWMVCDNSPGQRATMTLEIVLPASSGLSAAGPGQLKKQWQDERNEHFVFEERHPVQTYLFSFGVGNLHRSVDGKFIFYTPDIEAHKIAFTKTADAYAFLRSKAGVDFADRQYTQAFMAQPIEQEAGGLALMPAPYLAKLERGDQVMDMAHELAHQWWGVLVGIRSWSDFWLNEGMATFMADAYLEHHNGRAAYDQEIALTKQRMEKLRAQGKDRPLHWEAWKDATDALGRVPYVKGALFLDRLRTELGEDKFWRGIALYTSRNAQHLVDSEDFERAMEEAAGRDLKTRFNEAVYH
jgi:aminopeptidase N